MPTSRCRQSLGGDIGGLNKVKQELQETVQLEYPVDDARNHSASLQRCNEHERSCSTSNFVELFIPR
jgi:hypothetical protein